MTDTEVLVIGGGPAGLAAAIEAHRQGAKVLLLEREARLGGILKQCVHDGFGLIRFGEKLSGPEYAGRFIRELQALGIPCRTLCYGIGMERGDGGFTVTAVSREGLDVIRCRALVLATGCRERTSRQVAIHGTRPAGIFTAGTAQHLVNRMGQMPAKTCVVLGSGDIGLIMARRLTLEGAKVEGVYEAKAEPSGLQRNLRQCLEDFHIPLHLRHTVTRVFGQERLTAVEVARVDENLRPIPGTQRRVACDGLILSVGLIPENELAQALGAAMDQRTKGPACDERLMTTVPGAFSCGNALHVSDLVDYVTQSGELAGRSAAAWRGGVDAGTIPLTAGEGILYLVPARVHPGAETALCFFRADRERRDALLTVTVDGKTVLSKRYAALRPPEMQRLTVELPAWGLTENSRVAFSIREGEEA